MGDSDLSYIRRITAGIRRRLSRAFDLNMGLGYLVKVRTSHTHPITRLVRDGGRRVRNKKLKPKTNKKLKHQKTKPTNLTGIIKRHNWNNTSMIPSQAYPLPKEYATPKRIQDYFEINKPKDDYQGSDKTFITSYDKPKKQEKTQIAKPKDISDKFNQEHYQAA